MIIRNKIKNLEDFIIENAPEEEDVETKDGEEKELSQEIDKILNNLKKLEIRLDSPTSTTQTPNIGENLEPIYENTESYQKGFDKGQAFSALVGVAALATYLKGRALVRIKKKKKKYQEYWEPTQRMNIDKKYSDQKFDKSFNKEDFLAKETQGIKDKVEKKLSKLDSSNPKHQQAAEKLRATRDEKIKKLEEDLNKKIDQKKEKLKVDIDRKIEDLAIQWKRDDADTNIAGLFSNLSGNPAGGKMQRVWEDWKLEYDRKVEDKMIDYERKLIDEMHGEDDEALKKALENLDKKIKLFKKEEAEKKQKAQEANAKIEQQEKEVEAKEAKREEEFGDEYVEAKSKYNKFIEASSKFGSALAFAEKNTKGESSEGAKEDLRKSYKTLVMRSNFSKANAKQLMPDGNDKDYETLLKERQEQMALFKKAYNETMGKFKETPKEPVQQEPAQQEAVNYVENKMILTEKLDTYDDFLNESKIKNYAKRVAGRMKKFFKAVGKEGKETGDAVRLIYQSKKEGRELTDAEKENVKEQLKDVLRTAGLGTIAVMPGGFIVAVLLKAFELENAIIPSSFK